MKLSIITAVLNRADTIGRALLSIKSQNINNEYECIVIDGGSTDGSLSMIKELLSGDDILISEPDNGIYDALNKGIANARGDIIGFMHSDDFYASNDILAFVLAAFEDKSVDLVAGDVEFFVRGNDGNVVRKYSSGSLTAKRLSWGLMPAHPAVFVKKSIFDKYGGFQTQYKIAADYEFFCRLANIDNINYQYYPKSFIRMQLGGISTKGINSMLKINSEVISACRNNGIKTNYFKIICKYFFKILELRIL